MEDVVKVPGEPDRPFFIDCPHCGEEARAMRPSGGWSPDGDDPDYDHYWCDNCSEVTLFEEYDELKARK